MKERIAGTVFVVKQCRKHFNCLGCQWRLGDRSKFRTRPRDRSKLRMPPGYRVGHRMRRETASGTGCAGIPRRAPDAPGDRVGHRMRRETASGTGRPGIPRRAPDATGCPRQAPNAPGRFRQITLTDRILLSRGKRTAKIAKKTISQHDTAHLC